MISDEYLVGKSKKIFDSIKPNVMKAYETVIESLKDKSVLPYRPVLYPIPFMPYEVIESNGREYERSYVNMIHPDPKDFNRWGIFSTITFLERFPNYVAAGIGHEFA